MKSKSPFQAKIDIFQGSTSTYRHPSTVIQPIVGAQVGAQIAKTAGEQASKVITAIPKKSGKGSFDFNPGQKPEQLAIQPYKHDFSKKPSGRTDLGYRTTQTDQANTGVSYDQSFNKLKKGKDGKALATGDFKGGDVKDWEKYVRNYNTRNINQERDEIYDVSGKMTSASDWRKRSKSNSPNTMKGSPVKLIGDTMDPNGQINKNDLTGMVDPNQPQALGNRDFRFNQDSIAPGRLGSASSVNTQNQIFGGGQAQTAAEQLQTPLAHKTETSHTEPHSKTRTFGPKLKKGDPYIVADYEAEGGKNPPDTLNLAKFKQPDYMKNPGELYEKNQYVNEDIFDNEELNNAGFNAESTSTVKIFEGN